MYEHSQVHVIDIDLQNKINEVIREVNKLRKENEEYVQYKCKK